MSRPYFPERKECSDVERQIVLVCVLRWRLACAQEKLDTIGEIRWASAVEMKGAGTEDTILHPKGTGRSSRQRQCFRKWKLKQPDMWKQISNDILAKSSIEE